jgi:hypothetical protein
LGSTGRVRQQRGAVGIGRLAVHAGARVHGEQVHERDAAGRVVAGAAGQCGRDGLEQVELGGRHDVLERGLRPGLGDDGEQLLEADGDPDARVAELMRELAPLVHRVHRRHHAAGQPDRMHRDGHLRDVLQHERDPIAGAKPTLQQRRRQRVGVRGRLAMGERRLEVEDRRVVGTLARATLEELDAVAHRGLEVRWHVRVVARPPRAVRGPAHGSDTSVL